MEATTNNRESFDRWGQLRVTPEEQQAHDNAYIEHTATHLNMNALFGRAGTRAQLREYRSARALGAPRWCERLIACIEAAIEMMPDRRQKTVLIYRYRNGLTKREISKLMGFSPEAVKTLLNGACRSFEECFIVAAAERKTSLTLNEVPHE